jgi:hypothetical protein
MVLFIGVTAALLMVPLLWRIVRTFDTDGRGRRDPKVLVVFFGGLLVIEGTGMAGLAIASSSTIGIALTTTSIALGSAMIVYSFAKKRLSSR